MKAPNPAAAVNASRPSIETLRQLLGPDAALIPVEKGEKRPALTNWQTLTCTWSADPANEARLQTCNVGVNLGASSGGLISIDFDDDQLAAEMVALNPVLTKTLTSRRSRGCNFWVRALHPWPSSAKLKDDDDKPVGEWRADGNQTVIAGEAEGVPYTITNEAPVQIVDFHALRWPARIRQLPQDPIRQIVEADKGEILTKTPKKNKSGEPFEEVRTNTVPLAHYVARRARIFHEADTGFFWQYQQNSGAWQRVSKNRVKQEAELAIHQLAEMEEPTVAAQMRTNHQLNQLAALVEVADERQGNPFHDRPHKGRVIHAANAMLLIEGDSVREMRHAPEFLSRYPSPLPYVPDSRCPRFLEELVRPMFSPEDLDLVQRYLGACLLHHNAAQQLLLIRGPGDAGKGTLVRLLEQIIGDQNVTELRTHQLGTRFEMNQCAAYSLLLGQEADAEFLSAESINVLKAMVGGDSLKCEAKGRNATYTRRGDWNVIITSNYRLRVHLQGDVGAWRRRLLIVDAKGRGDRTTVIPDFENVLLREEGPGILAWLVEGAVRHVAELQRIGRFELSAAQQERVENLLAESESARHFAEDCLEKCQGAQLTVQDALVAYAEYADAKGWELGPDRRRSTEIQQAILEVHRVALSHDIKKHEDSKACRGWRHLRLRTSDSTEEVLP